MTQLLCTFLMAQELFTWFGCWLVRFTHARNTDWGFHKVGRGWSRHYCGPSVRKWLSWRPLWPQCTDPCQYTAVTQRKGFNMTLLVALASAVKIIIPGYPDCSMHLGIFFDVWWLSCNWPLLPLYTQQWRWNYPIQFNCWTREGWLTVVLFRAAWTIPRFIHAAANSGLDNRHRVIYVTHLL